MVNEGSINEDVRLCAVSEDSMEPEAGPGRVAPFLNSFNVLESSRTVRLNFRADTSNLSYVLYYLVFLKKKSEDFKHMFI